jgi:tetratricopeptide (TPR) repeat protein
MLLSKFFLAIFVFVGVNQETSDDIRLMTNWQVADKIRNLAMQAENTKDEQVKLVWILLRRSIQGDEDAHKAGKAPSERLKDEDELNPRARFAYGYFRLKEAYDTRDPVLRKRRIDEGRRAMTTALPMGARDADFLFDAGSALANLLPEVDLYKQALNSLTISKRLLGETFENLSGERKADWFAAMGMAFDSDGLVELARDHYQQAFSLSPDSATGRKALSWLRSRGVD